jgi:hypothetical protein
LRLRSIHFHEVSYLQPARLADNAKLKAAHKFRSQIPGLGPGISLAAKTGSAAGAAKPDGRIS